MAKTQSLAAKGGALSTELKLPSIFSAPMEAVKSRFMSPYITFAHPKRSDEWAKISAMYKPDEHDMFLVSNNKVTDLPVAKLGWMCHKQYWAEANAAGEVLRVSFQEMPHPFKEHIEAVVLVYSDDNIVPANVCFRTTKCGGAKTLSDALLEASTPAWADKGPAYRDSMVCGQPFMRFYGLLSLAPTRTSKSTGLPYRPTQCSINATTTVEWQLMKQFIEDAETQQLLQAAADRFESRVREMQAKPQVAR